jgi:hypothetical protein
VGTLVLFYTDETRNGAEIFKTEGESLFDCLNSLKRELVLEPLTEEEERQLLDSVEINTSEEQRIEKAITEELESCFKPLRAHIYESEFGNAIPVAWGDAVFKTTLGLKSYEQLVEMAKEMSMDELRKLIL